MKSEYLNEVKSNFRSSYYNAVSDCCFNILSQTNVEEKLTKEEYVKIIEDAHEWFMTHFFDENGVT